MEDVHLVPLKHPAVLTARDVEVTTARQFEVSRGDIDLFEANNVVERWVGRIQTHIRVVRTAAHDHKCDEQYLSDSLHNVDEEELVVVVWLR